MTLATTNGNNETIRVLHVDDDPDLADLAATFLQREDARITVQTAPSAEKGLELLSDAEIDCIVSDYDMPGWNGIEFLEAVRERYPNIPFILYTGKGSEEIASEAISAGVTEYLQKGPGTSQYSILAKRIENAVKATRAEAELEQTLERVTDAIYTVDTEWRITYVNEGTEEIMGSEEELLGQNLWEEFPDAAEGIIWDNYHEAMDTQEPRTFEVFYEPLDLWASATAYPSETGLTVYFQDITDQKRREIQLQETTSRLEALFDNSPDMIDVLDPEGILVEVNNRFCAELDYTEAELVGKPIWDIDQLADPDDVESLLSEFSLDERRKFEGLYERRDGSTIPVEVHLLRLDLNGEDRFMAISRDISERKERQQELERQLDLFEKAQDIANVGAWEYDVQTQEGWMTDEAYRIHGLPTDVTPTSELSMQHYHPEDIPLIRDAFERAIQEGESYDLELRFIDAKDQEKWIRTQGEPQPVDADPVRIRGTIQDISERKQREEELQASQERYESLFTSIQDAIVVADTDRQIIDWNPAFTGLFGYSGEEIEGESTTILYEDPEEIDAMGEALERRGGDPQLTQTMSYQARAGYTFPGETRVSYLRDADGNLMGFIGLIRDVSKREERTRQIKMIDRVLRHNLHNDMNVILGWAEQIRSESTGDPVRYAELITETGTHLLETTDKEREVTKFLADTHMNVSHDAVDLVTTTVEHLQTKYPDAEITVDVPETATLTAVEGFGTAIEELIQNAIIHSGKAQPTVTVRLECEDEHVQIRIADDGPGIPEMERHVLTEGEEIGPLYHGSGFGLWLVNLFVKHSYGRLTVEENDPQGTMVIINIPTK